MRLLGSCRLLTLVGPGGCGKTRLGIEVAREWVARSEVRAAFVDLSAIGDSKAVTSDVARQLGVQTKPRESVQAALVGALNEDPILLLLDNCEPVLDACRELLSRLLDGCPRLKVVATSREPLRLAGELVWRWENYGAGTGSSVLLGERRDGLRSDCPLCEPISWETPHREGAQ